MATVNEIVNTQRMLNSLGQSLTVDGVLGSGTISAIKKFQIENNMLPTGLVDKELLSKLSTQMNQETGENFFTRNKAPIIMSVSLGILLYGIYFVEKFRKEI
jgi:peptidoglycan hydrolase-like protein with peptidoglycan-binding domain